MFHVKHSAPATPEAVAEDWETGGFGLYVHWPFCESKCPYCDFNSHVAASIAHERWERAYVTEIARLAERIGPRRLDSIFFGGGTPSLMAPRTVEAVVSAARHAWKTANTLEVTLEANPSSVEIGRFQEFAGAGISRVSLGVQSLDDTALRLLGRRHSAADARQAWDVANTVFERVSLDLIYARQFQSPADWQAELTEVLAMNPRHLSLYQLTIESGTAFGDRHERGKLPGLPDEDRAADMFEETRDRCAAAGLAAYEVSNHAIAGEESRHNLIYWRCGDYAGIGPGAHGRVSIGGKRLAQSSVRAPGAWLSGVEGGQTAHETLDDLSRDAQADELLMMGLRLAEGVDLSRWRSLSRRTKEPYAVNALVEQGLLWHDGTRIGTTPRGAPLLNAILRELL